MSKVSRVESTTRQEHWMLLRINQILRGKRNIANSLEIESSIENAKAVSRCDDKLRKANVLFARMMWAIQGRKLSCFFFCFFKLKLQECVIPAHGIRNGSRKNERKSATGPSHASDFREKNCLIENPPFVLEGSPGRFLFCLFKRK